MIKKKVSHQAYTETVFSPFTIGPSPLLKTDSKTRNVVESQEVKNLATGKADKDTEEQSTGKLAMSKSTVQMLPLPVASRASTPHSAKKSKVFMPKKA
jgi:hypothetical protein